jgi:hypothetical protein
MTPKNDTAPPNIGGARGDGKHKKYHRRGFRKPALAGRPVLLSSLNLRANVMI